MKNYYTPNLKIDEGAAPSLMDFWSWIKVYSLVAFGSVANKDPLSDPIYLLRKKNRIKIFGLLGADW